MKDLRSFILVDDNAGADVTPQVLAQIAAAVQAQIALDFAPHWGWVGVSVLTGPAPAQDSPAVPVYIRAKSDVEGAAGYHDDAGIYVFRDGLPELTKGAFSLSVVVSHEILEALGDPGANRWADMGNGVEVAIEMCDAVEGFCYDMAGTDVSDFLLPSYFDPGGAGPYSFMGKPSAPFAIAPDANQDYQIERRVNEQGVKQVTAALVDGCDMTIHPRASAKRHHSSRTSRRGVPCGAKR